MRFPNPNLVPHGRFAPSLRVVDSYVGATSGPTLGPGGIFMGLLSSGTPGRLTHRSRWVTPSSVFPQKTSPEECQIHNISIILLLLQVWCFLRFSYQGMSAP